MSARSENVASKTHQYVCVEHYPRSVDDRYYLRRMKDILDALPKLSPPAHHVQLTDHVYIGNHQNANDLELLRETGITHVLSCAATRRMMESGGGSPYAEDSGIRGFLLIPAEDRENYDIARFFDAAIEFLNEVKAECGKALVHCNMGVNRSAAVVTAYLMVDNGWTILRAVGYVKTKRLAVLSNKGFRRQLIQFARDRGFLDPVVDTVTQITYNNHQDSGLPSHTNEKLETLDHTKLVDKSQVNGVEKRVVENDLISRRYAPSREKPATENHTSILGKSRLLSRFLVNLDDDLAEFEKEESCAATRKKSDMERSQYLRKLRRESATVTSERMLLGTNVKNETNKFDGVRLFGLVKNGLNFWRDHSEDVGKKMPKTELQKESQAINGAAVQKNGFPKKRSSVTVIFPIQAPDSSVVNMFAIDESDNKPRLVTMPANNFRQRIPSGTHTETETSQNKNQGDKKNAIMTNNQPTNNHYQTRRASIAIVDRFQKYDLTKPTKVTLGLSSASSTSSLSPPSPSSSLVSSSMSQSVTSTSSSDFQVADYTNKPRSKSGKLRFKTRTNQCSDEVDWNKTVDNLPLSFSRSCPAIDLPEDTSNFEEVNFSKPPPVTSDADSTPRYGFLTLLGTKRRPHRATSYINLSPAPAPPAVEPTTPLMSSIRHCRTYTRSRTDSEIVAKSRLDDDIASRSRTNHYEIGRQWAKREPVIYNNYRDY